MCREVKKGEFYRHFKGNTYQIREIAKDVETQCDVVVYQGMYAPYTCWVRSLTDFIDKVDHEKYPDAMQVYRFEKIDFSSSESSETQPKQKCDLSNEEIDKIFLNGQAERYLSEYMTPEEIRKLGLMQLLDAQTFHAKREIFKGLKKYLNERLINNIAVALDIVLEEGTIEMQYDSILNCLNAFEHYEGGRLR